MDIIPRATDVPDENVPDGVPEPVNEIDPFFVQKIGKRGKDTRLANAKRGKWKWRLAFALILVLILGGVGIWQYVKHRQYRWSDIELNGFFAGKWPAAREHEIRDLILKYRFNKDGLLEFEASYRSRTAASGAGVISNAIAMVSICNEIFKVGENFQHVVHRGGVVNGTVTTKYLDKRGSRFVYSFRFKDLTRLTVYENLLGKIDKLNSWDAVKIYINEMRNMGDNNLNAFVKDAVKLGASNAIAVHVLSTLLANETYGNGNPRSFEFYDALIP
jgi:hypothetical protein